MYKVTCENPQVLESIAMDIYYRFDREAQVHFSKGRKLDCEHLWFKNLTPEALNHVRSFPVKVRKQRV